MDPTSNIEFFTINGLKDLKRATIGMRVFDCLGNPAGGVRVSMDPTAKDSHTTVCYLQDGNQYCDFDSGTGTRPSGLALFLNVVPDAGHVSLTATPIGFGAPSSVESVDLQARVISTIDMWPTQ